MRNEDRIEALSMGRGMLINKDVTDDRETYTIRRKKQGQPNQITAAVVFTRGRKEPEIAYYLTDPETMLFNGWMQIPIKELMEMQAFINLLEKGDNK